jgi:hypothetical protein
MKRTIKVDLGIGLNMFFPEPTIVVFDPNVTNEIEDKPTPQYDPTLFERFNRWFELNWGWFFINGNKQNAWYRYLRMKYKKK